MADAGLGLGSDTALTGLSSVAGQLALENGGRTWTEYPSPVRCAGPACANRVRALAVEGDGSAWVGTERGLYGFDPARGQWIDRRGRATCGPGPVVKGCRVDLPPIEGVARGPAGGVYAATASGVYRTDGDALNSCDAAPFATALLPLANGWYAVGRTSGLAPCRFDQGATLVRVTYGQRPDTESSGLRRSWFRRPIALDDQPYIDQTYRYGSTMGGNFQQHQGVEFNNPDGTSVHAIGDGVVVFAGPAEQGSITVAIRHDLRVKGRDGQRLFLFSTYYHNRALLVALGQRVKAGDVIAQVGNTGRATNDHLHLEVHASPVRFGAVDRRSEAALPALHHQSRAVDRARSMGPASSRGRCSTPRGGRCPRRGCTASSSPSRRRLRSHTPRRTVRQGIRIRSMGSTSP